MSNLISRCLIISLFEVPDPIREIVIQWHGFRRGVMIPARSEFSNHWDELSMDGLRSYHEDQSQNNGFKGDLNAFIREYELNFEVWLLNTYPDELKVADEVLVQT